MIRTRLAPAILLLAAACANPSPPRGAPPDAVPPRVVRVSPESAAVNVSAREIEFVFDEVVSERPQGVSSLSGLFLISPGTGEEPRVSWQRRSLSVRPRQGWLPNTTYTVRMLPGVVDLQNNARKEGAFLVFSTGPSIDSASISGILFDWVEGRVAANAIVQARRPVPAPPGEEVRDTAVYSSVTDSTGRFTISNLPAGDYEVRGFLDVNTNRVLDPRQEKFDTAQVSLTDSARVELLAFAHDSVAPTMELITVRDSFNITVRFNRPLDPTQTVDTTRFRLIAVEDSSVVPLALARPEAEFERQQTPVDSARADSLQRADSIIRARRPDSLVVRQAVVPSRPRPPTTIVIQPATPLGAGKRYILEATGIRGILGLSRDTTDSRAFTVPERTAPGSGRSSSPPR